MIFSEKNARGPSEEMLRDSRGAQRPPVHTAIALLDGVELDSIVVEEGMSHDDKLEFRSTRSRDPGLSVCYDLLAMDAE